MVTVGYGDVVAISNRERLVIIFLMIISCGIFGYTLNSINTIFTDLKKNEMQFRKNLVTINRYMK